MTEKTLFILNEDQKHLMIAALEGLMDLYSQEGGFSKPDPGTILTTDPEDIDYIYESLGIMYEMLEQLGGPYAYYVSED